MKSYTYRVTVEMLTGAKGEAVEREPLVFEAANHDDLLMIAERMRGRFAWPEDEAAQLAIGFKLLSEVALLHRNEEVFARLRPALREFIEKVKALPGI